MWRGILIVLFALAGCVQLPPTPQDIQAKKFEPVPDKAVIYIVRPGIDAPVIGSVSLDAPGAGMVTTQPRTYYRWEVAPGRYRIAAMFASTAAVTLQTEPGKIYFVQQTVTGSRREGTKMQFLEIVDDRTGRRLVADAELL